MTASAVADRSGVHTRRVDNGGGDALEEGRRLPLRPERSAGGRPMRSGALLVTGHWQEAAG